MTNTNTNQAEVRAQLVRADRESLAHTLRVRVTRMQDCAAKVAELAAQIEAADENGAASLTRGVAAQLRLLFLPLAPPQENFSKLTQKDLQAGAPAR
jgi:hypothetical protein